MLVESLELPTDKSLFKGTPPEEIFAELKNAEIKARRHEWEQVLGHARKVISLSTTDYLHTFKGGNTLPNLASVITLIKGLGFASQCTKSWQLLRDAENIAQRAFASESKYISDQHEVDHEFGSLLYEIAKLQDDLIGTGKGSGQLPRVLSG